jgi:non-heme chloroperoxidase
VPLPNHTSHFVTVNGVRLHYLDWGGQGPALIFLTGLGSTAYIFSQFASRFTDRFHVLGLTRRGHGDSDYPETGYDPDTLTEDIRQFMDALQIDKATLVGHSVAGVELTHFAATHPGRVEKLVYVEALDDRRSLPAIDAQDPLRQVQIQAAASPSTPHSLAEYIADLKRNVPSFAEIWNEVWDEEIAHSVEVNEAGVVVDRMPDAIGNALVENLIETYAPKTLEARLPTLSIYGQRKKKLSDAYTAEQKAAYEQYYGNVVLPGFHALIADFQGRFPQAEIVVIPNGHHYCFIAQAEIVDAAMRSFLLG